TAVAGSKQPLQAPSSATSSGIVKQIVVRERACLQPPDSRGRADDPAVLGIASGRDPPGETERRTQKFASGDEIGGGIQERGDVRADRLQLRMLMMCEVR